MPRPRLHATNADRQRAYRRQKRLTAVAPDAVCRTFGSCTVYCRILLANSNPRHISLLGDRLGGG